MNATGDPNAIDPTRGVHDASTRLNARCAHLGGDDGSSDRELELLRDRVRASRRCGRTVGANDGVVPVFEVAVRVHEL